MRKHKSKIIIGILLCLILGISFFVGEMMPQTTQEAFLSEPGQTVRIPENIITDESPAESEVSPETVQETEPYTVSTPQRTEQAPEPEDADEKADVPTCTLLVRCDSVLSHLELLPDEKKELIPKNGIIFPEQTVTFSEGESVFDVLYRELRNRNIHFEFVSTPMYDSVYIEGIGNLYEFDCGASSGWMYQINGEKPTYGCSQYQLKVGDKIEFFYSCAL